MAASVEIGVVGGGCVGENTKFVDNNNNNNNNNLISVFVKRHKVVTSEAHRILYWNLTGAWKKFPILWTSC